VQPDVQRTGGDLYLRHLIVQIEEGDISASADAHRGVVGL
jgi:hypothetical protein